MGFVPRITRSPRTPMLERLEKETRPISDLHTHQLMRSCESYPSRGQVELHKGPFELRCRR